MLRADRLTDADIPHIADEIESMSKPEKRALVSRLAALLLRLLKWRFQAARRSRSWQNSIEVQRIRPEAHLRDNPSLKSALEEAVADAYRVTRLEAENETGLDRTAFPSACLWLFEQMMAEGFRPEGESL